MSAENRFRIYLVRHGESQGNVDQKVHAEMADHAIPLSDRGREQAREAGRRIAEHLGEDPGHIRLWTSPYQRTRETADGIEQTCSQISDRREHILLCEQQFGLFDGISDEELPARFPAEHAHYSKQEAFEGRFWARMPLGESRFDVATRIHQAFGSIHRDNERHGIQNLIVVCHGVTLRAFVMMWCHLSPEWFEAEPNPGNCAVWLLDGGEDRGYVFGGFGRDGAVLTDR